jgi:hypothetical protein
MSTFFMLCRPLATARGGPNARSGAATKDRSIRDFRIRPATGEERPFGVWDLGSHGGEDVVLMSYEDETRM